MSQLNQEQSEVAQLRAQIEIEHQAMVWALTGLSQGNTQHAYISRRMGHTEIAYKGLRRLVGDEQATSILCEVWANSPEQDELPDLDQIDEAIRIQIHPSEN